MKNKMERCPVNVVIHKEKDKSQLLERRSRLQLARLNSMRAGARTVATALALLEPFSSLLQRSGQAFPFLFRKQAFLRAKSLYVFLMVIHFFVPFAVLGGARRFPPDILDSCSIC